MYFVISLYTGNHIFNLECDWISDAYDAVLEASAMFDIDVDLDAVMVALVGMNEGTQQSYKRGHVGITRRERGV